MLQQVLTIRTTVFHLTDDTNQFWMQTMDTQINGCALTCLDNLIIKLLLHFGNHLLNAGWVDTTIADKLMERQTADLTTYRIKS